MIPEFALRLICGLSCCWCVTAQNDITPGFFRIQMLLTLGLATLTLVTAGQLSAEQGDAAPFPVGTGAAGLLIAVSFAGSVLWTLGRRRAGSVAGWLIFGLSTIAVLWLSGAVNGERALRIESPSAVWLAANAMTSAFLLGSVTAAMLLGHWYLTATGMSLAPLQRYVSLFGAAVVLRLAIVGALWGTGDRGISSLDWLRWGGLIGPLILWPMTQRILRHRNTQSATGVLYAATILVFLGEMAGALQR